MRRKIVALFLGALGIIAMAETRTAYILVPNTLDTSEVKVTGIIKESPSSEIYFSEIGVDDPDTEIAVVVGDSSEYSAYTGTKYIKMSIDGIESTDEVKFILGYPVDNGGIPTYTIVSSSEIKDSEQMQENFEDEAISGLDMIDMSNMGSHSNYDDFPGKELSEDITISGFVVGNSERDESIDPSNIVDIYYKTGDIGDPVNIVNGGAPINPTGSPKNNEFQLWAIKTDEDGEIVYEIVNGEEVPVRTLLYSNKGDETPLFGDFSDKNYTKGQLYPSDDLEDPYENFVFDVVVRFQGGGNSLNINGEDVTFSEAGFKWEFYNIDDVALSYGGSGNQFYFGFEGDSIIIVPEDPNVDVPPPVSEELYVIENAAVSTEDDTVMTSKYQGAVKTRTSSIKMRVLSGASEKSYEIEHIDE